MGSYPATHSIRGAAVIVASKPLEPTDYVSRFGGTRQMVQPAMMRAGQMTLLEHVIVRLQTIGVAPIVVITGFEGEALERHLSKMAVICLNVEDWQQSSIFSDAMQGLNYVARTCAACEKILLATPLIPAISTDTLKKLLESEHSLAVPVFEGVDGLPLVVSKASVSHYESVRGEGALSDFILFSPQSVERINVSDQGEQALFHWPMRARIKLSLARETIFFGPGPATLLRLIDETGSVRTACVRMKLSYSKGWQILNLLEKQLGLQVLCRRSGGQEGGSSRLTEEGRDLLHRYERLASEAQSSVNALFDKIFEGFGTTL